MNDIGFLSFILLLLLRSSFYTDRSLISCHASIKQESSPVCFSVFIKVLCASQCLFMIFFFMVASRAGEVIKSIAIRYILSFPSNLLIFLPFP